MMIKNEVCMLRKKVVVLGKLKVVIHTTTDEIKR